MDLSQDAIINEGVQTCDLNIRGSQSSIQLIFTRIFQNNLSV